MLCSSLDRERPCPSGTGLGPLLHLRQIVIHLVRPSPSDRSSAINAHQSPSLTGRTLHPHRRQLRFHCLISCQDYQTFEVLYRCYQQFPIAGSKLFKPPDQNPPSDNAKTLIRRLLCAPGFDYLQESLLRAHPKQRDRPHALLVSQNPIHTG